MTPHAEGRPRGALVAVGGNEDKGSDPTVLRTICDLVPGGAKTVEVLPLASSIPKEVSEQYLEVFGRLKIPNVDVVHILSRDDARNEALVRRIREADVIYFTGGDQLRITSLLGGSPVLAAVKERYAHGGVVAGTSAGAAAMSATMIFEGAAEASLRKGNVRMTPGLGFITSAVIDTHLIKRGRLSRLIEVVASNPGYIGVGLGEDTGIIVRDGRRLEVIGTGVVVIADGHDMRYTNLHAIRADDPIAVERVIVHTLSAGHGYDLESQTYHAPGGAEEGRR